MSKKRKNVDADTDLEAVSLHSVIHMMDSEKQAIQERLKQIDMAREAIIKSMTALSP